MALAPENTMAGFELAEKLGVDEVEFDVHRTRDGVPVILHDDTLDRTTAGHGPVREQPWDEVRALGVPSLEELCAWVKPRALGLSLELKQPPPATGLPKDDGLVDGALAVLRGYDLLARTVLHSFDHSAIAAVIDAAPDAITALLWSGGETVDPLAIARAIPQVRGLHLRWTSVSREVCDAAHAEGMHIHAWGQPEPLQRDIALRLVELGVDSLSANDPGALIELLKREHLR